MLFSTFVVDIGANALFLLIYYGTSLLRNEVTAPSSTHMKFVSYSGMAVPLHGNDGFPSWERWFLFMGTVVPFYRHCIISL